MKKLIIGGLLLLLSGCSSKFVYNNLDWLIHWYLDDYITIDKPQRRAFDQQFRRWHSWHREQELARYVQQLQQLRSLVANGSATKADIAQHVSDAYQHWVTLRNRIAPDLVAIAVTLSDEQVEELFAALAREIARDQQKLDRERQKSEQRGFTKRRDEVQEDLQQWLGRLNAKQESIVTKHVQQFRPNMQNWLVYQAHVQEEAKQLISTRAVNPDFQGQLLQLLTHPEAYRHPALNDNAEFNRQVWQQMIWELLQTITAEQRAVLLGNIDDYIADFSALRVS